MPQQMMNPIVCVFTNKTCCEAKISIIEIHGKFTQLHTILRGFLVWVLRTNSILHLVNTAPHASPYGDQTSNTT